MYDVNNYNYNVRITMILTHVYYSLIHPVILREINCITYPFRPRERRVILCIIVPAQVDKNAR